MLDAAAAASLLEPEVLGELHQAATGKAAERPASSASVTSNGFSAANGVGGAGVPAFKLAMASALKEYFNSADAQEVAAR